MRCWYYVWNSPKDMAEGPGIQHGGEEFDFAGAILAAKDHHALPGWPRITFVHEISSAQAKRFDELIPTTPRRERS